MDTLMTLIFFLILPMAIVQSLYRIIDRKAHFTDKITTKFPIIVEKKKNKLFRFFELLPLFF